VDEYIEGYPEEVRVVLEKIRATIRQAVPRSSEKISYKIPTVTLDGKYLVYYAAWKHHIAVYPVPAGDEAFERELAPYREAKGTLRFPLAEPIPYGLIGRVAKQLAAARTRVSARPRRSGAARSRTASRWPARRRAGTRSA
jgi:uncharacterized protein YdhG (YjbR/CyaY superfamily)